MVVVDAKFSTKRLMLGNHRRRKDYLLARVCKISPRRHVGEQRSQRHGGFPSSYGRLPPQALINAGLSRVGRLLQKSFLPMEIGGPQLAPCNPRSPPYQSLAPSAWREKSMM